MKLLLRWVANAGVLLLISQFLSGIEVTGWYAAFITALVLGLVNAVIRPILFFFTLPINILTLGLFTFVLNGFLFWFVGTVVDGFSVVGFWPAFWGALIMAMVNWIVSSLLKK
jgi:putative membrane protein